MEDKLWIEDIVESTPTFPFLSNSRINMVGFVHLHKVVAKKECIFSLAKCMKLRWIERWGKKPKVETSIYKWKGIWIFFKKLKIDTHFKEESPKEKEKGIVMKDKDLKYWLICLDGEILHLTALRVEMKLEFVKNAF
jgi:hypothetical protein